jgi:hypothetical protein
LKRERANLNLPPELIAAKRVRREIAKEEVEVTIVTIAGGKAKVKAKGEIAMETNHNHGLALL